MDRNSNTKDNYCMPSTRVLRSTYIENEEPKDTHASEHNERTTVIIQWELAYFREIYVLILHYE